MKAFQAVTDAMAAEGLDHMFAVMGDANQDLIVDLGERHGARFVHTHHESSAVGMADGYARFSGKPGLASVTQGPGYTNATTSLVAARLHRTPLMLLAGHASLRDPYNPQGMVDQQALARLTTEATVRLESVHNVDYCLGEAFRQIKVRKGPFILNLPQDVQQTELPDPDWTYRPMYAPNTLQPPRAEDVGQRSGCSRQPDGRRFSADSGRVTPERSPRCADSPSILAHRSECPFSPPDSARTIRCIWESAADWVPV